MGSAGFERTLARHQLKSKADRFGKQKRHFDSPRRHFARFWPVAFIFDERAAAMVNRWCVAGSRMARRRLLREPHVKSHLSIS
jgi:hypothetical protein